MIDRHPASLALRPPRPQAPSSRRRGMARLRMVARRIDGLDPTTAGHSERVAALAGRLALELGWPAGAIRELREAARVHDVGKIVVPESVLVAHGRLSPEQYALVKDHAAIGADMVAEVLSPLQASWVRHHHERWDGRGYPDGVAGEDIPDGAAILCLADSWDAMRTRTWTGPRRSAAEALEECCRESGGQFAPWAVQALIDVLSSDGSEPLAPVCDPLAAAA